MSERIVVLGLNDFEQGALDRLLAQLESKRERNLLRSLYYGGKHTVNAVGSMIPAQYYQLGLLMGWPAKAVDLLARRSNLDGFVWAGGDVGSLGVFEVMRDNHFAAELNQAVTASCKHATSFLVVSRGVEGDGEPPVLIHGRDALNCTGLWNARKRSLDCAVAVTGRDSDSKPNELALFMPNETIVAEKRIGWVVVSREEHFLGVPVEPLPYRPEIGRPFGSSRITRPLMAAHNAAARTLIRLEAQSDAFSLPLLMLLGADDSVFKNPDGTPSGVFRSTFGAMLGVPDDQELLDDGNNLARAAVQQITAASPKPHIDTMRQWAQIASSEVNVPEIYFGVSDKANPSSADALFIQDLPLITAAERAMEDWSPGIQRTMVRALQALHGLEEAPNEWLSIKPDWRDARYESKAAQADAGAKIIGTLPWLGETEIGLELLGLDATQIERAMSEKRRAQASLLAKSLAGASGGNAS